MSTGFVGATTTIPDVCPYCGIDAISGTRCLQCRGLVDPLSLQASQNEMGPWTIRSDKGQFLPGCSYQVIVQQIAKGRLHLSTVLRGPTTRQFWMKAARTPGVAHLLGICHSCNSGVVPGSESCPNCHVGFVIESSRQNLGLGPVLLVPGQQLEREVVVAGQRLPSVLADSVDLEPVFLEDETPFRPLPRTEKPVAEAAAQPRTSRIHIVLVIWAILATGVAATIAADSWLELGWGLSKSGQAK